MKLRYLVTSALLIIVTGCKSTQEITQFNESNYPTTVCIAQHAAVKEGMLDAIQEGFQNHGIKSKIIEASYPKKHGEYSPTIDSEMAKGCDAVVFYTGIWRWDLALYMAHANIWVTDSEMKERVAQASYTTGYGLDKFINAREKILELVNSMVGNIKAS